MKYLQLIDGDKLNKFRIKISKRNFFASKRIFKKPKNERKNSIKKFILIFVLLLLKINNESNHYYLFNKFVTKETVKLFNLNFTKAQYMTKGLEFLNKIKKSKLNNYTNQINHPKISVIIPIYNCAKTIELSVKSINFQNLKELEIILINDFSKDNSSTVIEELYNYDKRIRIINNKKNMGTLYSRSLGALTAKGEYIIGLDNDDLFLCEDILETVYIIAKINNFDIVEIKSLNIPNYSPSYKQIRNGNFIYHPNNLILYQPKLGRFSITRKNKLAFKDHFAWGKCIKSKIYKKAVNNLGYQRYSTYNCWTEDMSMVFVLFNTARSFIFLNLFGILRLISKTTTTHKLSKKHKFLSGIFFLGILFDFSKNDKKTKGYVAQQALRFSLKNINKLDSNNKLYFKSIIKKLIECKFLSKQYKLKLIKKFHY